MTQRKSSAPSKSRGPRRSSSNYAPTKVAPFSHPLRPGFLYRSPSQIDVVFFDLETTGGNPSNAAVMEIAAVRYSKGVQVGSFHTLVNPRKHIPGRVRELTGISNNTVKDAPPMEDVIGSFLEFIGDAVLVSHGVVSDYAFIVADAKRYANVTVANYYLCTHLLVANFFPNIPNKSLSGVASYFGTPPAATHRAEADAMTTAEVFWKIYEVLEKNGFSTVEDLLKVQADTHTLHRLGTGILTHEIEDKTPTTPGIFYFFNPNREISFVSAAANLRKALLDTARLGDEREFNKILVDARDFKFHRTAHFLAALLQEKQQLRKLNLPIDPRRLQKRSEGFVQLLIPQDIVEFGEEYPHLIPFKLPPRTYLDASLVEEDDEESASPDNGKDTATSSAAGMNNYAVTAGSRVPIRKVYGLNLVKKLEKFQIQRSRSLENNALTSRGPLQEGVGWFFGPFDENPRDFETRLQEALVESKVTDESTPLPVRAANLWAIVQTLYGQTEENSINSLPLPSPVKGLMSGLLNRFSQPKPQALAIAKAKRLSALGRAHLPRFGIAVITNPEYKELDVAVVVAGSVRKSLRLAPEEGEKLGSSRFFTRLFESYKTEIEERSAPMVFTSDTCADVEILSYWLKNRTTEGEWADFDDLSALFDVSQL